MNTSPSPIERAYRARATISWLNARDKHTGYLPGTRNTLDDLALGYRSFLNAPWCEIAVDVPSLLTDSDFLGYVYSHMTRQVDAYNLV